MKMASTGIPNDMPVKRSYASLNDRPPPTKIRRVATVVDVQGREWFANGQIDPGTPRGTEVVGRTGQCGLNDVDNSFDDSGSSCSSGSDSCSSDLDENDIENVWKRVFSQTDSVTTTSSGPTRAPTAPIPRQNSCPLREATMAITQQRQARIQRTNFMSASTPAFRTIQQIVKTSCPGFLSSAKPSTTKSTTIDDMLKPDEFLRERMLKDGITVKTVSSDELHDFFHPVTEATVEGYDLDLVTKVKQEDVDGLRELMKKGRNMQCSNQFGESIVHMACRRKSLSVLEFLFREANVSCKLCCDSGRTPLHDACWTSVPDFGVIQLLLERCPDLLYITDNRGFTPMNYVRHTNWGSWCDFLGGYDIEKLTAKELWVGK